MTRYFRLGAAIAASLIFTPLMTAVGEGQGAAPTVVTIPAGEEKEICAGVKAAVTPAPQHGTLRTDPNPPGDTVPVRILYKASDTATAEKDSLTCTVGADKKPLEIRVTPIARNAVTGFSDQTYPEAFKALFLLFVLAAVLESALAILFNWRPFIETFNARAVRPVVTW